MMLQRHAKFAPGGVLRRVCPPSAAAAWPGREQRLLKRFQKLSKVGRRSGDAFAAARRTRSFSEAHVG